MEGDPDGAREVSVPCCETINEPPAPFHPIARGRGGPNMLAMILDAKFSNYQPLDRQSEMYAREGIDLDVSTLAPRKRMT
jgi:transposase